MRAREIERGRRGRGGKRERMVAQLCTFTGRK